jgi:hypothetical protein
VFPLPAAAWGSPAGVHLRVSSLSKRIDAFILFHSYSVHSSLFSLTFNSKCVPTPCSCMGAFLGSPAIQDGCTPELTIFLEAYWCWYTVALLFHAFYAVSIDFWLKMCFPSLLQHGGLLGSSALQARFTLDSTLFKAAHWCFDPVALLFHTFWAVAVEFWLKMCFSFPLQHGGFVSSHALQYRFISEFISSTEAHWCCDLVLLLFCAFRAVFVEFGLKLCFPSLLQHGELLELPCTPGWVYIWVHSLCRSELILLSCFTLVPCMLGRFLWLRTKNVFPLLLPHVELPGLFCTPGWIYIWVYSLCQSTLILWSCCTLVSCIPICFHWLVTQNLLPLLAPVWGAPWACLHSRVGVHLSLLSLQTEL